MRIIELPEFQKQTRKLFSVGERAELLDYMYDNPLKGDVVAGTGGARKLRFGIGGRGKRGGVRVIYYYRASATEMYLFSAYAKNEKSDLAPHEKRALKEAINLLK